MTKMRLHVASHAPNSIGLMGHVIADYPTHADARAMIDTMVESGVEVIEIQIPFSEPMADGPVFLVANHRALAKGVNYEMSLALMREVATKHRKTRFVFMTYLNVIFRRGYDRFVEEAMAAGAAGVIVPDLPLEHADQLEAACARHGFVNVSLIPPNCPDERMERLCGKAKGLVYAVARSGVTGAKTEFGAELKRLLDRIRARTDVPIAVGFGVRSAADVTSLRGLADYAVIGTRSLQCFEQDGLDGFRKFWEAVGEAAGPR